MSPNNLITTTTNQWLAPEWVDQVLRDNLFFGKILSKPKRWKGSQMLFPMKYQKGIASVPFSGFDVLPINQVPTTVNMFFYPSFVATNIALAGTDISQNRAEGNGSLKVLDLMEITMKSRAQDAADDIGDYLQGDGTAAEGKAPMGLAGIVDNGADLAQYGGLSRATYQGLNAYINAINGNITLLSIRTTWNQITDGSVRPDMLLTDYTTWGYIEQLFSTIQRNMMTSFEASAMKAPQTASSAGYADLVWDGMSVFRDKKVTTGTLYLLNTDYLNFYALKWWEGTTIGQKTEEIKGNVYQESLYSPAGAFTWTGWIRAYNMGAINGFVILGGQLICTDPWRNAAMTGILGS